MSNSLTEKKTTGNPDLDEALDALISMMGQYCRDNEWSEKHGREMFDHQCMSAGEDASDVLIKHGWITCNNLSRL